MNKIIPKLVGGYLNTTAPVFPKLNREHAFKILCRVDKVPISEEGIAFFQTATTQYLKLPEADVALHSWGNGPKKILFLHGWMSHSKRWQPYLDRLDLAEYTVYSIDAPAHGLSRGNKLNIEMYRHAVEETLQRTGAFHTMVCHSLGSLVGAYTFLHQPEIPVNQYVMMGAPAGLHSILDFFRDSLNLKNKTLDNLLIKVDSVLKVPAHTLTMEQFFKQVEAPVLVVHEESDAVTPIAPIRDAIPKKASLQTYFTTGQDHNLTAPETPDRILQFITQKEKEAICI